MFSKAIVRRPSAEMIHGITSARLGVPDYLNALKQHEEYIHALKLCGLEVIELDEDNDYPDSVFVEDTALLTSECAIITNPGAPSRKGEINEIKDVLYQFYDHLETVEDPGTVEAGDIMMTGSHYYIGLSNRTNKGGAEQIISILNKYNLTGSVIPLKNVLHLKSGVSYLGNNNLVATGEFLNQPEFRKFNVIEINENESYASNCIWVNGTVILPEGYPNAKISIENLGYKTLAVDVSEFRKLDGGVSCLSLRF